MDETSLRARFEQATVARAAVGQIARSSLRAAECCAAAAG